RAAGSTGPAAISLATVNHQAEGGHPPNHLVSPWNLAATRPCPFSNVSFRGVATMAISRRRFLQAAAGTAGAACVGAGVYSLAAGTDYAIQGIDASHWQGSINWTSVKNSGKTFAFYKATEGTTYTDPTFAANWAAIKNAGLIRGAYHFGHPGSD